MTATTAAPLDTLAQLIARQQAELQNLREEYEARQTRLTDLTRRREELQTQLQQVEADIQATTQGGRPRKASAPDKARKPAAARPEPKAAEAQKPVTPKQPSRVRKHSLPALLMAIVRKADGPVTVKEMTEQVKRRKFPTTSGNLARMINTRVRGLVERGLLQRASGQPGIVLGTSATGAEASASHAKPGRKPRGQNGTAAKAAPSKTDGQAQRVPLRVLLTDLLAKSRRPMSARELADQVLASGYQTKSKKFMDVMWVALGQMDNVENVPGKGWRLKKR